MTLGFSKNRRNGGRREATKKVSRQLVLETFCGLSALIKAVCGVASSQDG